ncbi:MAG: tyrosine-type recombinase/integrase [Deltaproteobacteria bacterium]|nr:tyrosine-type recombinase/integrase [Deltaproteobacteria bacterium]
MPRQTRHSTEFSGVYFVKLANENQSFFIRYKRNGKSVEEKAGHSNEGWDAEIACLLRAERMAGTEFQQRKFQHDSDLNASQLWTFSKIFEKYLRLRPDLKGRENDIYRFKNYLELDFADIAPEVVTHGDVERFRHNLQNKGLKPATVRHVLELLRRLANFAVKKNYCRGLSFKLEMPKVENQKTEELTHDQLQKLMRVLEEDPDLQVSNLVRMVLYTGMRRGELFELCWSDIDFYNKIITVRSGKNVQHPTIPLNEMAEKVLAEHAHVEGSSKFVFPGRGGKKRTECKRPLLRIRKNAGLPDDFRLLQGLRHVYATKLVSSGKVDLETLQSLLTQKSPLMTQRYAHLLDQTVDFTGTEIASDNSETVATEPVAEIPKTVIASDYTDVEGTEEVQAIEIATDYTDVEETEEVPAIEIATDYTENADTEQVAEITETVIASDYTDVEETEEVQAIEIATDYTDVEETEEVPAIEIATDYTENADTESVEEITDTVVASNYTHVEGTEEVTAMDIATDYTDMGESAEIADVVIATDNMDSESNEGVQPTVKVQESSDIEIAKKNMDSVQQEELEETESETKTPELSQLVKQNYTAFKPTEIHQREVYSSKNIVVDNKVANHVEEKSAQQNARPSLKDLKNDLKSLSQLIQAAPRRSKITTAKRNLN